MPQVPLYDGPQVTERALQPVYQRTPDVSSGAQSLAQSLGRVGERAMRQAELKVEAEATTIDQEITSNWLSWNSAALRDPKYRGQGIDQYEADAAKWWEDTRAQYSANASAMAKQSVGQKLGQKLNSAMASVTNYALQSRERFADEQYDAAVNSEIEFGIDTGDVAGSAQRIRQMASEVGARKGWTTEMVMAEQQKRLGVLHLTEVQRLAESDAEAAQAYYDQHKGELPADVQARTESLLKASADDQFASAFALEQAGRSYSEALASVREIDDPERRKKAQVAVNEQFAMERQIREQSEQDARNEAWQLVAQNRPVPERILSSMDGASRVTLQDYQAEKARKAALGEPVVTDWGVYYNARRQIAAGEPINLEALSLKLAPTEFKELIKLASPVEQGGGTQDALFTLQQRIDQSLSAFPDINLDSEDGKAMAGQFQADVDRRVREESLAKKRKLTPDEEQLIVDRATLDRVYVDEWGSDPQLPVGMLSSEQLEDAYVTVQNRNIRLSSIPADDRLQIISALRQSGIFPTEQQIATLYLQGQQTRGKK